MSRVVAVRAPSIGYRGLLVLGALGTAWLVVAMGIARHQVDAKPSLALAAWPGDATALATLAATRIGPNATPASLSQARGEALGALHRDLTQATAYAMFGAVADLSGQYDQARAGMLASDALSRRVLLAHLWLIQDAVVRGQVAGALRNFDVALRTSGDAQLLLFPVLGRALNDDRLVPAITALLQSRPPWAAGFLYATIADGQASTNLVQVMERLVPSPDYAGTPLRPLLVAQLVAAGDYTNARRLAAARLPLAGRSPVVDPTFTDPRGDVPFNWELTDDGTLRAARIGDRPGLQVDAGDGAGGVAASQLLMLAPGSYALSSLREGDPISTAGAPAWTISCGGSDQPLAALAMAAPGRSDVGFAVPPECPFQWLRLTVRAADGPDGQTVTIDRVQVRRTGSARTS